MGYRRARTPNALERPARQQVTEGLEGGFDWMLTVRFRDRAALAGYLPHPEHRPVAEFIGAASARVVVFDVEDAG